MDAVVEQVVDGVGEEIGMAKGQQTLSKPAS
jgi:hypothetical protein